MALGKSRTRINSKGKGVLLKLAEIASGGALTSMDDVGYLTDCSIVVEDAMVDSVDAGGQMINSQSGSEKVTIKGTLKQTSADEINLVNNAGNKFHHAYLQVQLDSPTVTYQEWYAPVCKIKPGVTLEFKSATERTIALEIVLLMPKGAVSVTPAGLNVAAGSYYTFAETATTPLGQVTTSTGTIYTAAV